MRVTAGFLCVCVRTRVRSKPTTGTMIGSSPNTVWLWEQKQHGVTVRTDGDDFQLAEKYAVRTVSQSYRHILGGDWKREWIGQGRGRAGRAGEEGSHSRPKHGPCYSYIKLVSANSFCLDTVFLYRMTNTHCFMLSLHVLSNFASVWYMPLNCLRSLFSVQPPWWDG